MSASYTVLKTLGRYAPGTVLTVDALAVSAGFDVARLKDLGVIRDATSGELSSAIALPDPEQSLPSFTTDGTPDGATYAGRAPTGAILTDISTSPPTTYVNTGTIAAPTWQAAGGGGSAGVSSLNGATGDVTLGDGTLTTVSGSGSALQVDVTLPGVTSDGLTPGGLVAEGNLSAQTLGAAGTGTTDPTIHAHAAAGQTGYIFQADKADTTLAASIAADGEILTADDVLAPSGTVKGAILATTSFVETTEITTPAAPPAGSQRLFVDSADHLAKLIDSASVITRVGDGLVVATYQQGAGVSVPNDGAQYKIPPNSGGAESGDPLSPDWTNTIVQGVSGDDEWVCARAGLYLWIASTGNYGAAFTTGDVDTYIRAPNTDIAGNHLVPDPTTNGQAFIWSLSTSQVGDLAWVTAVNTTEGAVTVGYNLAVIRLA